MDSSSPNFDGHRLHRIIRSYLEAARAGSSPDRAALIADHPELAEELHSFFENHDRTANTIGVEQASDTGDITVEWSGRRDLVSAVAGENIPIAGNERYQLLGEIARGGMGIVYRALDRKFDRPLAVKVLRLAGAEPNPPELLRRFFQEARITGSLQHPGVPPVHDVGQFEDGTPFFSMKLIEGETLYQMLARRPSPATDLLRYLRIFEQIAQTLAFAHRRGTIHRDLKPQNVMVGAFGEVQVMDWGLAKPIGTDDWCGDPVSEVSADGDTVRDIGGAGDRTEAWIPVEDLQQTQPGQVFGTLAYMPPEQARGDVSAIAAHSDVFGLGGILCNILTGAPPYMANSPAELMQKARHADLAEAFQRLDAAPIAAELIQLTKQCLAADPAQRLTSADGVAAAISRHLAGIQERLAEAELERSAAEIRAREEKKRRQLTVALVSTLALLAVGIFGAATWYQLERVRRANEAAQQAHARELQIARVEQSVEGNLGEARRALENAAMQAVDRERWNALITESRSAVLRSEFLVDQLGADAPPRLLSQVAEATRSVDEAERDLRTVLQLQRIVMEKEFGFDRSTSSLKMVASREKFKAAFKAYGLDPESTTVANAATLVSQKSRPIRKALLLALEDWLVLARLHKNLASETAWIDAVVQNSDDDPWLARLRQMAAAGDFTELLQLSETEEFRSHPPSAFHQLAVALLENEPQPSSLEFLRRLQLQYPQDFMGAWYLAVAFDRAGQREESIVWLRIALALRPDEPELYNALGAALLNEARVADAESAFARAVELDPNFGYAWSNLGLVRHLDQRVPDAIACFQRAIELEPRFSIARHNLAMAFLDAGRPQDAAAQFRSAIELESAAGPIELLAANDHPFASNPPMAQRLAVSAGNLSAALYQQGLFEEAVQAGRQALTFAPNDVAVHVNLGASLSQLGRFDDALEMLEKAAAMAPSDAIIQNNLGKNYEYLQRWDEARSHLREALRLNANYPDALFNLGSLAFQLNDFDEAADMLGRLDKFEPQNGIALAMWGESLRQMKRFDEASEVLQRSLKCGIPDVPLVQRRLALAVIQAGNAPEGSEWLQRAVLADPQQAYVAANEAVAWSQNQGANPASEHVCRAILAIVPKLPAEEQAKWEEFWREHESILQQP